MDDENEGFLVGARATVSDTYIPSLFWNFRFPFSSDNESLDDDSEYTQSKDETDELHAQGEDETNEPQVRIPMLSSLSFVRRDTQSRLSFQKQGRKGSHRLFMVGVDCFASRKHRFTDCVKLKSVEIARAAKVDRNRSVRFFFSFRIGRRDIEQNLLKASLSF